MKKPTYNQLIKLLGEAASALDDELHAAGEDEAKDHPILRAHKRLYNKIRKTIDAAKEQNES